MINKLNQRLDSLVPRGLISLVRFPILFLVWGLVGYNYKLFLVLSVPAFILSLLFFIFSISATIGFKTRTSMALLGLTVLAHGYLFLQHKSMALGLLLVFSSVLELGRYYSLDRYLQTKKLGIHLTYPRIVPSNELPLLFKIFFVGAAAFIVGGPAYNQILNHNSKLFRSWVMFQEIGNNLINVDFFTVDGSTENRLDYLTVLGHDVKVLGVGRGENAKFKPDLRIVGKPRLERVISRLCRKVEHPETLRVRARIATVKTGWTPVYDGSEPICSTHGVEHQP